MCLKFIITTFAKPLTLTARAIVFLGLTKRLKIYKPVVRQLSLSENELIQWLDYVSYPFLEDNTRALSLLGMCWICDTKIMSRAPSWHREVLT